MNLAFIESLIADPRPLLAVASALAAAAAVLAVAWPQLQTDELAQRLRKVENERERIRARERARLDDKSRPTPLRLSEPRKIYRTIVERFMGEKAADRTVASRLTMAGYRGPSALVTYLAIRALGAGILALLAFLYAWALAGDQPFFVKLGAALLGGAAGYYGPPIYVKNRMDKRKQEVERNWPDALDLLLICIESGMAIESAFRKVAEEIGVESPVLAEELSLTTAELAYLQDRRKAYENLAFRTDLDCVRGVVTSLIQAERYGTPLARSLKVLAQENRDERMARAEKKAAALPPKLTVPMILFFLPVLFAVIITPAAIQMMEL